MEKQLVKTEEGEKLRNLKSLIEQAAPKLAGVLPKHVRLERLITIANAAMTRQPKLQECTSTSILLGIMRGAELGLEVGNGLNHASLVPFFNNKANPPRYEATFIPGYKGLMLLASNHENILFDPQMVFANETFEVHAGTKHEIIHRPSFRADRGDLIAVYTTAFFPDGRYIFDIMTTDEVDSIRARSRAKDSGPWVTDFNAMALKTVIRRLCWRKLNLKAESPLAKAVTYDQDENPGYEDEVSEILKNAERQAAQSPKKQLKERISQRVGGNGNSEMGEKQPTAPVDESDTSDDKNHVDEKNVAPQVTGEAAEQEKGQDAPYPDKWPDRRKTEKPKGYAMIWGDTKTATPKFLEKLRREKSEEAIFEMRYRLAQSGADIPKDEKLYEALIALTDKK